MYLDTIRGTGGRPFVGEEAEAEVWSSCAERERKWALSLSLAALVLLSVGFLDYPPCFLLVKGPLLGPAGGALQWPYPEEPALTAANLLFCCTPPAFFCHHVAECALRVLFQASRYPQGHYVPGWVQMFWVIARAFDRQAYFVFSVEYSYKGTEECKAKTPQGSWVLPGQTAAVSWMSAFVGEHLWDWCGGRIPFLYKKSNKILFL